MTHAKAINARYGGLVQRWLFVLLALMTFLLATPAQAARINGGLGIPGPGRRNGCYALGRINPLDCHLRQLFQCPLILGHRRQ